MSEPNYPFGKEAVPERKYLDFSLAERLPKTTVYEVRNALTGVVLGTIRWYGAWRKYTLQPYSDTIWHAGCLQEVASFIDDLMRERKQLSDKMSTTVSKGEK